VRFIPHSEIRIFGGGTYNMGDKGGKKDREKSQKQKSTQKQQDVKRKQDKQQQQKRVP